MFDTHNKMKLMRFLKDIEWIVQQGNWFITNCIIGIINESINYIKNRLWVYTKRRNGGK